jgi:hypothetical protein
MTKYCMIIKTGSSSQSEICIEKPTDFFSYDITISSLESMDYFVKYLETLDVVDVKWCSSGLRCTIISIIIIKTIKF